VSIRDRESKNKTARERARCSVSVSDGRLAVGTVEVVNGAFTAITTDGVILGEFATLREASRAFHDGGER
jgi:hypothetical protein